MHHDKYEDRAAVLPTEPVPDSSMLVELLDKVNLKEMPLLNRCLNFFQMCQRTGKREMMEQFVELLEARARSTGPFDGPGGPDHVQVPHRCCARGNVAEWWQLENPSLPEMKRALTRYKAGKTQKKALKKTGTWMPGPPGPGRGARRRRWRQEKVVPLPPRGIPEWCELCLPCGANGHIAAACGKRREAVNCKSYGWQGHSSKVCLTSYKEKN